MSETNAARNTAQVNVDSLNALHTEKKALSAQLTEQINTLSQEIADLQKSLNEETELRTMIGKSMQYRRPHFAQTNGHYERSFGQNVIVTNPENDRFFVKQAIISSLRFRLRR